MNDKKDTNPVAGGDPNADDNPWDATTLEWSVPQETHAPVRFTTASRYDTGVSNVTMGFWLFLASEVMLFGAMFSAYALLRSSADSWPHGRTMLRTAPALINTGLLLVASVSAWMASRPASREQRPGSEVRGSKWLVASLVAGVAFLAVKVGEFRSEIAAGILPRTNTFFATYFTLTGLHALHVIGAVVASIVIIVNARRVGTEMTSGRLRCLALYWGLVELVWLAILGAVYLS